MPSSTVSLEPLSSPSPSPTPPPPDTRGSTSNNSGAGAGLDSGSELSELTEDEPENAKADREDGRRQTKRKKRGGMIPPSMWEWAYGAKKKDPRSKSADEDEEEEEEEPSDLRRALEDEEDDERGSRSRSTTTPLPDRRRRRINGGASAVVHSDDDLDREHNQEDDAASADEASAPHPPHDGTNEPGYASEDDDSVPTERADVVVSREAAGGGKGSAESSSDENVEDDGEAPADDDPPDLDDPSNDNVELASDDEPIVTAAPSTAPPSATSSVPNAPPQVTVNRDVDPDTTLMDVDETAPVPAQVSPIIAAAAASSIMAGADVVNPPSPSPSASSASARQQSRSPSRSPSPEQVSDREVEPKRSVAKGRGKPRSGGRATRNRAPRRKPKVDPDQEAELDPAPDPEAEDVDDLDEGDLDSPEMDMELELQPAHRAEALDVLANIELKYAMLRESLYVEKMEALSWEEALVNNGVHPEMLHLQTELSNRRDKRLELARLRRDYEVASVTKRRKLDEDGVWSWWKLRRDELQTEMISEAHRKRRHLDRERRALERPQPIRRIPSPVREIGALPTLRDLVKASPFDSPGSLRRPGLSNALAYPQLSTLAPADIAGDVDFLFGHRRNAGMVANGMYPFVGVPPVFDQYNVGMPILDGPGAPNRFPHIPFQQGPMPPQAVPPPPPVQGYHNLAPPPPRLQHHHSAPSSSMPLVHPQMMIDQDFSGNGHRSGPGAVHLSSQMQQYPQAGPSSRSRRSPSPVHHMSNGSGAVMPSGSSSKSRGGAGGTSSSVHGMKEMKRGDSLRNMESEAAMMEQERERRMMERERDERERLREREREREWQFRQQREQEHFERELERSNLLAHPQRALSHTHPHPLNPAGPGPHPHPSHHHHHHHHVLHHHHPNSVNGLGPNASGQPQNAVPREASNGIGPGASSPRIPRDAELQRGHVVPVEVIELSSSAPQHASSHAYLRKANDDQLPLHSNGGRDRARGPMGPSAHERQTLPFVSPPMQSSQSVFPPSPRTAQGLSTAPASVAPSRRGSWSAPDGATVPRPSSSSSAQLPPLPVSQRLPASAIPGRPAQLSPNQPHRSPMLSPPRSSGIRLPPLSPPQTSVMRSPPRNLQALPSVPLSTPSGSHSKSVSPKVSRRQTPPPPLSRPRSPSTKERNLGGAAPTSIQPAQKHSRMSPVNVFPAPVSQPTPLPTSRLPNAGMDPEANLVPPPKVNAVPVD